MKQRSIATAKTFFGVSANSNINTHCVGCRGDHFSKDYYLKDVLELPNHYKMHQIRSLTYL